MALPATGQDGPCGPAPQQAPTEGAGGGCPRRPQAPRGFPESSSGFPESKGPAQPGGRGRGAGSQGASTGTAPTSRVWVPQPRADPDGKRGGVGRSSLAIVLPVPPPLTPQGPPEVRLCWMPSIEPRAPSQPCWWTTTSPSGRRWVHTGCPGLLQLPQPTLLYRCFLPLSFQPFLRRKNYTLPISSRPRAPSPPVSRCCPIPSPGAIPSRPQMPSPPIPGCRPIPSRPRVPSCPVLSHPVLSHPIPSLGTVPSPGAVPSPPGHRRFPRCHPVPSPGAIPSPGAYLPLSPQQSSSPSWERTFPLPLRT